MNFEPWFVGQHGKRPSLDPTFKLIEIQKNLEVMAKQAGDLATACELWDRLWTSARYAWNVSDKDKEEQQ